MTTSAGEKKYGIYVHIPFCKAKCKYCAFVSTPDFSLESSYASALIGEITESSLHGAHADTVYIGGGTPSCLRRGALTEIINAVRSSFVIDKNAEITVECNPESASDGFFEECRDIGVNRISMGLQSASDAVLSNIGRVHTYSQYVDALKRAAKLFDNISSDIILGLPQQSFADVEHAVDTASERCSHVSVYALTVEEGTPLYKSGYSADDDVIADMYDRACALLEARGFNRYEVSNFARYGEQSRHNNKYWECLPYIGFGVAAHGYDGEYTRFYHGDDICEYIKNVKPLRTALTDKDVYNEYIMLRLRTENGIDLEKFRNRFGFSFETKNKKTIDELVGNGYLCATDSNIRIAPRYMFVMNDIIGRLMLD